MLWGLPTASHAWAALAPLRPDLTERAEWWLRASPASPLWAPLRIWRNPRGRLHGLVQVIAPGADVLTRHYGLEDAAQYTRRQVLCAHWRRTRGLPARVLQAGWELMTLMWAGVHAERTPSDR